MAQTRGYLFGFSKILPAAMCDREAIKKARKMLAVSEIISK